MTATDLAATHAAAFTQTRPWSETEFAALLSQPGVILLGDAKSFLLARVIADEAEVLTLATHPDHQGRGLARALLQKFRTQMQTRGIAEIFLEVAENNIAAKSLYLNAGFELSGNRPRYYTTRDGQSIGADVLRLAF